MKLVDEFLNIDTPENVVFGYEVVGIGSRFLAALVDTLAILVIQIVVNLTLLLVLGNLDTIGGWGVALLGLVSFILLWGYYIFFETLWNGQSPGKRLVGLRVIRTDGMPITLAESIVRNLVRLVDFLPMFYGAGLVVMFIDDQARRLGDMAAGTLVVRDQADITLDSLTQAPKMPPSLRASTQVDAEVAAWPVSLLTERDIRLAEGYLSRRRELENGPQLARTILQRLLERMEMPDKEIAYYDVPYVLAHIVKIYREQA